MTELPHRYEPLVLLGSGGGGAVLSVRDVLTGETLALKVLGPTGGADEYASLLREATFLADAEGLGMPEVRAFGRTRDGRAYLVRTLVEGAPLDKWSRGRDAASVVKAVVSSLRAVAVLHRFGLLHGDLKPANIVVDARGEGHLVDLGLAVPWVGEAAPARGFTPSYAAPELFTGASLDGRTEVFALACTLRDALANATPDAAIERALADVLASGTDAHPSRRPVSVDEFAHRLHRALAPTVPELTARNDHLDRWRLVGLDADAAVLGARLDCWAPDAIFHVTGPRGAGVSTLLRRWALSAGVRGVAVELVDGARVLRSHEGVAEEALALVDDGGVLAVDNLDVREVSLEALRGQAQKRGVRLVVASRGDGAGQMTPSALSQAQSLDLVRRVRPDLGHGAATALVARAAGRPGALRAMLEALAGRVVVSIGDLDDAAVDTELPETPVSLARVAMLLLRGRIAEADAMLLDCADRTSSDGRVLAARIALGRGAADEALRLADEALSDALASEVPLAVLVRARALLRMGQTAEALEATSAVVGASDAAVQAEALALRAVSFSFRGALDEALAAAEASLDAARRCDARIQSIVHGSHGLVLHRRGDRPAALDAQEQALLCAESAGDASLVAVSRLNLAALAQEAGDPARALRSLEPVLEVAVQAGQLLVVQQALANLVSLDLHLGRLEHARTTLDTLGASARVAPTVEAHRLALEGEWHELTGAITTALLRYGESARAWEAIARRDEAALIRLEAALVAMRTEAMTIAQAEELLAAETPHLAARGEHPLPDLVRAAIAEELLDFATADLALQRAKDAARSAGLDDWLVRVHVAAARVAEAQGDRVRATRELNGARAKLEQVAARLPPDLHEVFWSDPRRRSLRTGGSVTIPRVSLPPPPESSVSLGRSKRRLARIVELTASLLGAPDAEAVLGGILDHAMALVGGVRGLLLLRDDAGGPVVKTVRAMEGDVERREFSRSVAERVLATCASVVTKAARNDVRLASADSVHRLQLEALVCVPIREEGHRAISMGAIYIEVPHALAQEIDAELSVLEAFSDLAAVALLRARMADENQRARVELETANRALAAAREEIAAHLAHRTEELQSTKRELEATKADLRRGEGMGLLVGASEPMRKLYARIERVRDLDVVALIVGESGTGKELVARAIHETGARAKKPFMPINCGAIAPSLLESELFGHERGAFTGADRARLGIFREAQGGTVFLDEVGELPLAMQAAFLRVLQERKVRPLGGRDEFTVDARIVVATNRDLKQLAAEGKFREDLYYRLNVVELAVPPLRNRVEDVPLLVEHFLRRFARVHGRSPLAVERDAVRALQARPWPGNVRQLEHTLLQAWLLADGPTLSSADFQVDDAPVRAPGIARTESERQERERRAILEALEATGWNRQAAAARLGIPRRTFYRRLDAYGILVAGSNGDA